ncbi:MAG TPA: hypothetical protein VLT35_02385 [Methanocella sp.]|nr:hypothetical protein [Methanocella sp.]
MQGKSQEPEAERKYDYQAFPENVELARQIERRLSRRGLPEADAPAAIREIADLQRYMTELYADVRAGGREAVVKDCLNIATSAFVVSLILSPDYYRDTEGASDPAKFVKKMGDAIALNEIDLDLATGRWSTTADLIVDMLSSLSVLTGTLAIEAEGEEGYIQADMDFNILTSCSLIAAFAQIVCQCAKNGSYRGQVLQDLKPQRH